MTDETQINTQTINTSEMQTYPASAVVNYMLDNAEKYGVIITPMKLQKLLYFANGWSWAFYNKPLISDECHAWQYGPVYPSVYNAYKSFGRNEIFSEKGSKMHDCGNTIGNLVTIVNSFDDVDEGYSEQKTSDDYSYQTIQDDVAKNLIINILKSYGKAGGVALSEWTHVGSSDNPWLIARNKGGSSRLKIQDKDIKEYFSRIKKQGTLK